MLSEAHRLTKLGFIVHPLTGPDSGGNSPGKRPIKKDWQKETSPFNENVIVGWWGPDANTKYNMGLVCGRASNVMVVDMDSMLFIDDLFDGIEIDSLRSARIKGRGHIFFKYDKGIPAQKHHDLGIEILTDGSNAVLPPSVHVSGDVYHWADPNAPIQEIPEELKTRMLALFDLKKRVAELIRSCRPCFRRVWKDKDDLHGSDGREMMLAFCTELKANGATLEDIRFVAKIVYQDEYDQGRTDDEFRNSDISKPWKCVTIQDKLSGFVSDEQCDKCGMGRNRHEPGYKEKVQKIKNMPEFMDGKQFIPKILGDVILKEYSIITFPDSMDAAVFRGGVYDIKNGERILTEIIKDKLGVFFQKNRLHEVYTYIQISTYTDRDEINKNTYLINVKNGMYDVKTNILLPHDIKYLSTIQLNVIYDPVAECTEIYKFLTQVGTESAMGVVIQYAGYSCTPDIKLQRTLLIDGPQQNGKSTFLEMVTNMIGQDNTSQQSLHALNSDRFARERLNNKLINYYGDLPAKKLGDNSIFKMLSSDTWIDGEKKGGQKFRFRNTIHQMYAMNKTPDLNDPDELAYFRRLVCVTFPTSYEGKADRDLIHKISTERELSGFFNLAMAGLRILLEKNEFCYNKSVAEIQREYLNKSNPVSAFLDECTEYSSGTIVKKGLYETFMIWCDQHNVQLTLKDNTFGMAVTKLGYDSVRLSSGSRENVWLNLGYVDKMDETNKNVRACDGTLTDYNQHQQPEITTNPSGCQGSKDILSHVTKIIYNGYTNNALYSPDKGYNPDTLTDSEKTQPDTTKKSVRVKSGTLTNPDGFQKDQRTRIKEIHDIILYIQSGNGNRATREAITTAAEDIGIADTDTILKHMASQGHVLQHEENVFQVI